MDLETYAYRENLLRLRERMLQSDSDIQTGRVRTLADVVADMRHVISEAANAGN